ncbi:MAG TPA: Crp/Fnr family transcriptional regulator [Rhodocyclaceae bacterium]|nr:Crp/Fnr family transcriptional regulator [Rhodocyclaceae bacterium]
MLFFDLFRHEPTIVLLKAGAVLFRQGDATNGLMYVLVTGQAEVRVGDQRVEDAAVGAILGEMAMVGTEPRSATVVAVTDCECAAINRKRFDFLVTETPGFAIDIMRVMADRLRRTDRMLVACSGGVA